MDESPVSLFLVDALHPRRVCVCAISWPSLALMLTAG